MPTLPMLSPLLFALTPFWTPAPMGAQDELVAYDLVPADALIMAHVSNLPGLRQLAGRNDFVRAMLEPGGVLSAFDMNVPPVVPMMLAESVPADQLAQLDAPFDSAVQLVDSVRGDLVFFMQFTDQVPTFGLAAYLGDRQEDFLSAADTLLLANEDEPFVELGGGFMHQVENVSPESGLPTTHVAVGHGWMAVAGSEDPLRCQTAFEQLTGQISGARKGTGLNPAFVEARKNLRDNGQVEVLVDLAPLMAMGSGMGSMFMPPEVHEGLGKLGIWDMGWIAMRGGLGVGEEANWELTMNLPSGGGLARLAETLRPVPFELFELVPQDVIQVSAGDFDMPLFLETLLEITDDFGPEVGEMVSGGLDQANAMVGFDLIDEFLGLVSGKNFAFKRPIETDQDDPASAMLGAYMDYTDIVLFLEDYESVEDAVVELAGMANMMSEGQFELLEVPVGDQVLWTVKIDENEMNLDLPIRLGFGELAGQGVGIYSVDQAGAMALLGDKPEKNVLSNPLLGPILKAQRGLRGNVQAVDTAAALISARDSMMAMGAYQDMFGFEESEELDGLLTAVERLDDEWVRSYFQGAMVTTLERTGGGLRVGFQMR